MTGIEELRSLKEELEGRDIRLALMAIHRPVMPPLSVRGMPGDEVTRRSAASGFGQENGPGESGIPL